MPVALTCPLHLFASLDALHHLFASRRINDQLDLAFRVEGFIRYAVPALMLALVEVSFLLQYLPCVLHALIVLLVGSPNEDIVANVYACCKILEHLGTLVAEGFWVRLCFRSSLLDLHAMLVCAREQYRFPALDLLPTLKHIREEHRVHVADMRSGIDVEDGRCRIVWFCHIGVCRRGRQTPTVGGGSW